MDAGSCSDVKWMLTCAIALLVRLGCACFFVGFGPDIFCLLALFWFGGYLPTMRVDSDSDEEIQASVLKRRADAT